MAAYQPRIEELSDSDPDEMDITELDPPAAATSAAENTSLISPDSVPLRAGNITGAIPSREANRERQERAKHWQCLYPLYFDAARTLKEGRRVGKALAVSNPLARDIVDAAHNLGLQVAFEPDKTHPRDWANPGRVKVQVKENGQAVDPGVTNKHHLYVKVAQFLQAHPTNESSPLRLRLPGMPPQAKPLPPPAVPRGWKMGQVLPLHSPAVTGGGVSDNLFKDMMAEMQGGQLEEGAGGGGGGGGKAKKDKKKLKG